jgi:hypothetical protein
MQKNENIKISFFGMKFECTNPTRKTIILTVLFLIFFVVIIAFLPKYYSLVYYKCIYNYNWFNFAKKIFY